MESIFLTKIVITLEIRITIFYLSCRYELGRGIPVSIRSAEPLQSGNTYTVSMDRSGNQGRLQVNGQPEVIGDDDSRFSLLNLYSDNRFVLYLGKS